MEQETMDNMTYDELLAAVFDDSDDGDLEDAGADEPEETGESTANSEVNSSANTEDDTEDTTNTVQENNSLQAEGKTAKTEHNARAAQKRRSEEAYHDLYKQQVEAYFKSKGFKSFADAQAHDGLQDDIKGLGFSGKDIEPVVQKIVQNMPEMARAQEMMRKAEEKEQALAFSEELSKISKLDPSIQDAEDLKKMEEYDSFFDLVVNRGYKLSDAFKLARYEKLVDNAAKAAGQKAINSVAGKNHFKNVSGGTEDDVQVPKDVAEQYRAINPGVSMAEIRAHYKKSKGV